MPRAPFRGGLFGTRRPRRRMRRNRPRWTADFADFTTAAGAISSQIICSEVDFGTSTTLESEALLLRVVGTFDCVATVAGFSVVDFGLVKLNESLVPNFGGIFDPGIIDSLIDDDWLYTGQFVVGFDIDAFAITGRRELDIRVKRKMNSSDTLRWVVSNVAGGVSVDSNASFRILLEPRL